MSCCPKYSQTYSDNFNNVVRTLLRIKYVMHVLLDRIHEVTLGSRVRDWTSVSYIAVLTLEHQTY